MSCFSTRRRFAAAAGVTTCLLLAAPALGATTAHETLSDFKIVGTSAAKAGRVTFKVKNTAGDRHELVVIKTATRAAKLKLKGGKAVETGKIRDVEVAGGATKSLTLTLKKGHYALICNIGDHYMEGMRKDFTVR